jgi:hypothetical protein
MNTPRAPREQQPAPPAALTIRLITKHTTAPGRTEDVPATAADGSQVRLYRSESETTLAVGKDGQVKLTPVDGELVVCVSLPAGWKAPDALPDPAPGQACWDLTDKTGVVPLTVEKG